MKRAVAIVVFNILALESISLCLLFFIRVFTILPPLTQLAEIENPDASIWRDVSDKFLHPYLGFASTHNIYGFDTTSEVLHKRSDSTFIVGVFGGSVAHQFSEWYTELLINALQEYPELQNKEIHIVPIAMGGYKQPQQLMALNYLLMLGAEFDAIVELDGFNEIAISFTENIPESVVSYYPRSWAYHVRSKVQDPTYDQLYAKTRHAFEKRDATALRVAHLPIYTPLTVRLLLRITYAYYDNLYHNKEESLREYRMLTTEDEQVTGPWDSNASNEERLSEIADIWKRTSQLMHAIATAHQAIYVHALQPNQYVQDSKKFSLAEEQLLKNESPYKHWIQAGYPLLQQNGVMLKQQGISFYDLTTLFTNEVETIYVDSCCHINQYGNTILAKSIAQIIVQELRVIH